LVQSSLSEIHKFRNNDSKAISLKLWGTIYSTGMRGAAKIDKTEKVGITLPIALVKQVDKLRGDIPRSTFIRRALEQYMKGKSGTK
jgi:hypothetical protein